jgi:putative aldouronate transport system permease protein
VDYFNETDFSFFGLIKLSTSVITHLEQDIIDSVIVIICMIVTLILPLIAGIYMLITKGSKDYGLVRKISLITILLSLLGLISTNSISIGALQVEKFYTRNWGTGFFLVITLNVIAFLVATIASYHEKVAGFVTWRMIIRQKQLILMSIPFIVYAFIFSYAPLAGWTMAFQKFKPAAEDQMWIAWDKFKFLFTSKEFLNVFRNTVAMSVINLILSFVFAIVFALLLNEVVSMKGKKFVQTVSYLPHFLSWIIVAGIVRDVLSMETGIINDILVNTNLINTSINFFADPKYFWWIIGIAVVWKETGWNSIIYLASISSINPDLYEAASIDGAGRLRKMLHITLPGIKSTVFVLLIINLGMIMNSGFEAQYLLGGDLNKATAQVIDMYVLQYSFGAGIDFSLGTAAGIFKSVVSILLIFLANRAAKSAGQERLF